MPHTTEPIQAAHPLATPKELSEHALKIWQAGVDSVKPGPMLARAWQGLEPGILKAIQDAPRVVVVGGGKAGAAMAEAMEMQLRDYLTKTVGVINVPAGTDRVLNKVRLNAARPAGSNYPTTEGVVGTSEMLKLVKESNSTDVCFCLISGGGSALLPAPAMGITLEDKQKITKLLHACGATIGEMNAIRKHLSQIKGGGLAQAFHGKYLVSFIVSDVIGDPLDVIASGPTVPDTSTYSDCLQILNRYELRNSCPDAVWNRLESGARGELPETLKVELPNTVNLMIGSNAMALEASCDKAVSLGYDVLNLGPTMDGDTTELAKDVAKLVLNTRKYRLDGARPTCLLIGGETTVKLGTNPGKGGRNQEFVLAMMQALGGKEMKGVCIVSGGTDGEDGPTDAAGAWANEETMLTAKSLNLKPEEFLVRNDAYPFFDAVNGLIKTGLTETNVMDVRVVVF